LSNYPAGKGYRVNPGARRDNRRRFPNDLRRHCPPARKRSSSLQHRRTQYQHEPPCNGWGSLGRPVIDKTGLQGTYDFTLKFTPEPSLGSSTSSESPADFDGPTFQEALKKQLGLRIESQKGEVQVIVLDHIDHLIEN
jgi:uncharacterized protein (TIGR03435 family)